MRNAAYSQLVRLQRFAQFAAQSQRKSPFSTQHNLVRHFSAAGLVRLGIGAIIGAGIFVLIGKATRDAGPAVLYSLLIAGFACTLIALCIAELASNIPLAGGVYSYSYAVLGELAAWVVGWDILLEYWLGSALVAQSWSAYVLSTLYSLGLGGRSGYISGTHAYGLLSLAAIIPLSLVLLISKETLARLNVYIVSAKCAAIILIIAVGMFSFRAHNWRPFLPNGWHGVVKGASLMVFAYLGFDTVSTAGSEAIRPERSLPIGIVGSLLICILVYVLLAASVINMASQGRVDPAAPFAIALLSVGFIRASAFVGALVVLCLTSVLLAMLFAGSRILMTMGIDGLLPQAFAVVHPKREIPTLSVVATTLAVILLSISLPLEWLAELVNFGTLFAFILVCISLIVFRMSAANKSQGFRVPWVPATPLVAILFCVYLMAHLGPMTRERFIVWLAIGMFVYFTYGRKHSVVGRVLSSPVDAEAAD